MSSSLDQRSSKGHENHDGNGQPAKEMEYHGYSADQQVPQAGYSSTQMPPGSASDSYVNYYAWNMPSYPTNPTGVMQEGVWSNRDSSIYSNYGQLANADYMQSGAMYNQYDYSYWYQGLDPSTTPWGPAGAMYKSRDYPNGSYYSAAGGSAGIPESTFNCDAGLNGAVQSMEQSFKGMSMAEEEKEIGGGHSSSTGAPANKKSWANVVTQQTSSRNAQRPKSIPRAPIAMLNKPSGEPGSTWDNKGSAGKAGQVRSSGEGRQVSVSGPYSNSGNVSKPASTAQYSSEASGDVKSSTPLNQTEYNPKEFDLNPKNARFFVIKSFSEDDIHRSIKYSIWCSTDYGNKRLDSAYREREGKGQVYLYFSVNGSGHFCGVALMTSPVDYHATAGVWAQDKWKGQFSVKWIYVKDVPNSQLRHIKLENNENKPVTNSRDTQEVPPEKGKQVLRIIHQYRHTTSIFDDFGHYEKQQEETSSGQRK